MKKKVSDLTPAEWQKAFPIVVEPYNPHWKDWYEAEMALILGAVDAGDVARINHIGSTAVEGLRAKPIVDILLEVDGCCHITRLIETLQSIGYGTEILTRREDPMRLLLGKGMTAEGFAEKAFLLHVRYIGNWGELYFRDLLRADADVRDAYSNLKTSILAGIADGTIERMPGGQPNGYSQAKLSFVQQHTDAAKAAYADRYKPQ